LEVQEPQQNQHQAKTSRATRRGYIEVLWQKLIAQKVGNMMYWENGPDEVNLI